MALGNNSEENTKKIRLKLVAPQGPTQEFPKFVRENEDYSLTDETYTKVTGEVKAIYSTHNGKTGKAEVRGFKAYLVDGEETYIIGSTLSHASKNIVNHLLANIGDTVTISLWLNKSEYPSASIKDSEGVHTKTFVDYDKINFDELYQAIKDQEPKEENKGEEIDMDNIPF